MTYAHVFLEVDGFKLIASTVEDEDDNFYAYGICQFDRFFIDIHFYETEIPNSGVSRKIIEDYNLTFTVWRDYDFSVDELHGYVKEHIPFLLKFYNNDLDKFIKFVKKEFIENKQGLAN